MSKYSKRGLALSLVCILIFTALIGCGTATKETTAKATTVQETSKAVETSEITKLKPVTLQMAINFANVKEESPGVYAIFEQMQKELGITIEWIQNSHDEHRKKMKLMASSSSLPDLFWEANTEFQAMAKLGALVDYTEVLTPYKDKYIDGLSSLTLEGKIYGVVPSSGTVGWFFNKQIFDKYGLTIPQTWDELLNACKVLSENGIVPIAQGTKDPWPMWGYAMNLQRYGWEDFKDSYIAKTAKWVDNAPLTKSFERIKELKEAGAFPKNLTTVDYNTMKAMFEEGKAAMLNSHGGEIATFEKYTFAKDIVFSYGFSLPDGVGNQDVGIKEMATGYFSGASVKNDPDKYAAAVAVMKWFSSQEGANAVVIQGNDAPATNYTVDTSSKGPVYQQVIGGILNKSEAIHQFYMEVPAELVGSFAQAWWDAMGGAMAGSMTPQQCAKKMDDWNETR